MAYGGVEVVHDVCLNVREGEIVSLLGSNGAGKSTVLRAISGLVRVGSGEIWLNELRLDKMKHFLRARAGIGHVPEAKALFRQMTVRENLMLGAFNRKDKHEVAQDLDSLLTHFPRLGERLDQRALTMSGGEQQMLAICRALMGKPRVLMLDEPSLGLAPKNVIEIGRIIAGLTSRGIGVLLVEQNARLALGISDRAYVLERGRVVVEGTSSELACSEQVKKAYLGQ
ncbi:MAG: ABC transporter ATP-binding protein [Actinobacteria bacterium]|nr:ABC transporter ATP-binding protein [Actinomycetota bacterium]